MRILFDNGSQQTYISPEARNALKLKTMNKKTVSIKSFGKGKSENVLDEVLFSVTSKSGEKIYVEALVSAISLPIDNQAIEIAVKNYPHLRNLDLADSNPSNEPLKIDILVGCQDY